MKRDNIFRIEFPERNPIYIFTKDKWSGLTIIINESHAKSGAIITPISLWRFIKEWLHK
jgi:hypothetical protein